MRGLDRLVVLALAIYVGTLIFGSLREKIAEFAPAPPREAPRSAPAPQQQPRQAQPAPAPQREVPPSAAPSPPPPDLGRGRVDVLDVENRRRGYSYTGTAWPVAPDLWASARHVVEGCARTQIQVPGRQQPIAAGTHWYDADADLALFRAPTGNLLSLREGDPGKGELAFGVGYPQRQFGVARLRLIGTERLRLSGRLKSARPFVVDIWDVERYPPLKSDEPEKLSGMSGGPVVEAAGHAAGVVILQSPRRGTVGSVTPSAVRRLIEASVAERPTLVARASASAAPSETEIGAQVRRNGQVAFVSCRP